MELLCCSFLKSTSALLQLPNPKVFNVGGKSIPLPLSGCRIPKARFTGALCHNAQHTTIHVLNGRSVFILLIFSEYSAKEHVQFIN
jgi:hypothetical protein